MDKPGWWPKNAEECAACPEVEEDTWACPSGDNYCERDLLAVARALVEWLDGYCEKNNIRRWTCKHCREQLRKEVGLE